MKLTFCGAAQTTTGSQHLLEVNHQKILLDCGLYQGRRTDSYERNQSFFFDPASVDCVVLSHSHIDHSGNLPNLVKSGFQGNIYSTFATRDLCQIMLADSAKIQAYDARWLNKQRQEEDLPPIEPLYSPLEAERSLRNFVTVGYDRPIPIANGVFLTFLDAGHILGSAQIILDVQEFDTGRQKRFVFTGDLGRGSNDILRDPVIPENVDYLLMESTYGNREHEEDTDARDRIGDVIREAHQRGGKVIIPAFAVERTQQLIYVLHRLLEAGDIPDIPIFVDSPLAVNATEIFRIHPECFNKSIYNFLFEKRNPFGFEGLRLLRSVTESKRLNASDEPAVIISASGMCESGRILHHLKNNIDDPKTTVLFVGYCAPNTLGRRIREKEKKVSIFGRKHRVRARIEVMDSFSGHSDRSELLSYVEKVTGPLDRVWLVHGEPEQSKSLATALRKEERIGKVQVAPWRNTVEF
ncbi:MAG: MBL fold metallo-hydrolase [Verrucomicrobiota bacterium]